MFHKVWMVLHGWNVTVLGNRVLGLWREFVCKILGWAQKPRYRRLSEWNKMQMCINADEQGNSQHIYGFISLNFAYLIFFQMQMYSVFGDITKISIDLMVYTWVHKINWHVKKYFYIKKLHCRIWAQIMVFQIGTHTHLEVKKF